ncbi:TetR/AcrR family transcriptional regulator [Enterococcus hailinensis]|uniref:TetR/AcrR family transcriptional regulator n=1 Tax=Enterococcus hailinensis TaxID=3238988 RepID=UPI0038B3D5C4
MKSKEKLQTAAMSLFMSQGYDPTTIKEIATLAGVTERTFFRQFRDKADVLFERDNPLYQEVSAYINENYEERSSIINLLMHSLKQVKVFDQNRNRTLMRSKIIEEHPDLIERELLKMQEMKKRICNQVAILKTKFEIIEIELAVGMVFQIFELAFQQWLKNEEIDFSSSMEIVWKKYQQLITESEDN